MTNAANTAVRQIFANANLLDGVNPAKKATVVVEGEKIAGIVTSGERPQPRQGDIFHDLSGATLMPVMTSGHFHTTYHNLQTGSDLFNEPPAMIAYRGLANAQTALRNGFTSCVGAGSTCDVDASLVDAIAQ